MTVNNASLVYIMLFIYLKCKYVCVNLHLLIRADRSLGAAGVLFAASLETVGANLEVTLTRSTGARRSGLDLEALGRLVGTGLVVGAPGVTAGIALAAATEAVGAGLEEASVGRADGIIGALGSGGRADGLRLAAGVSLAAAAETIAAGLEEAGAGRADSGVRSLGYSRADRLLLTTSIALAATTETVGTRLKEAGSRRADSRVRSLGDGRADTSAVGASVSLAASSEAVWTRLEETSTGSADGRIRSLDGIRADTLRVGAGIRFAAASETVGARLEETSGANSLIRRRWASSFSGRLGCGGLSLPLVTVNRVGNNRRLRLSDENKIASLGSVIATPLCSTRVYRAVTAEAIVTTDVVLSQIRTKALTLCGLGVGSGSGKARDGDKSNDSRMHFDLVLGVKVERNWQLERWMNYWQTTEKKRKFVRKIIDLTKENKEIRK
jgi:hypothetical protein